MRTTVNAWHNTHSNINAIRLAYHFYTPLILMVFSKSSNSIAFFTSPQIRILPQLNPNTGHNAGWTYHICARDEGRKELHLYHGRVEAISSFYATSTQPHTTTLSEHIIYARATRDEQATSTSRQARGRYGLLQLIQFNRFLFLYPSFCTASQSNHSSQFWVNRSHTYAWRGTHYSPKTFLGSLYSLRGLATW